jgi:hypothetical protein
MIKIQFFYIKYAWEYLEFGCMHTNKNVFFYFLNKKFWISFAFLWNFEEKHVYFISG